jgi:hypothetical protein
MGIEKAGGGEGDEPMPNAPCPIPYSPFECAAIRSER